jgi:threonine aldolase
MAESDAIPSSMGSRTPAEHADSLARRLAVRFEESTRLRRELAATNSVLADRERELLELKGPCSNKSCRLHYAHSGPCDTRKEDGE